MFNQEKVKVFVRNTRSKTGEYVTVEAKFEEKNIELELTTKSDDVLDAEEKTLQKVKKILTSGLADGKITSNFKLRSQCAEVELQEAVNNPVTGVKKDRVTACEVGIDLVIFENSEKKVKQQAVVSRRDEKDFEVAEDKAINRALELLGY